MSGGLAEAIDRGIPAVCAFLLTRLQAGHSREDPPLDRALLQHAAAVCGQAIAQALAADRPFDAAIGGIGRAAAMLCAGDLKSIEQAELALGRAIPALMGLGMHRLPAGLMSQTYQLLADLLVYVIGAVNEADRELFVTRALGIARAAEYLAACDDDDAGVARARDVQARALTQLFAGSRDANLMAAVDAASRSLGRLGEAQVRAEVRWPVLALEAGNAAMKVTVARSTWLAQAQRFHALGRSVVDPQRYPGLLGVFDHNLAMYRPEAAKQLERPPDQEMFERFRYRGRAAGNDAPAALRVAAEMRAWASSLPDQPNAYLGHALIFAGRVFLSGSAFAEAADAANDAAGVFAQVFRDDATGQTLVAQSISLRDEALRRGAAPGTT